MIQPLECRLAEPEEEMTDADDWGHYDEYKELEAQYEQLWDELYVHSNAAVHCDSEQAERL